jgi:hypothetical protein
MTMPHERTRALLFGGEFLIDLRESNGLSIETQATVEVILRHYPSASEIRAWAEEYEQTFGESNHARLTPEKYHVEVEGADVVDREIASPQERTRTLCQATDFFHTLVNCSESGSLSEDFRRQIWVILCHFPARSTIEQWARVDENLAKQDPNFKAWLLPSELE